MSRPSWFPLPVPTVALGASYSFVDVPDEGGSSLVRRKSTAWTINAPGIHRVSEEADALAK